MKQKDKVQPKMGRIDIDYQVIGERCHVQKLVFCPHPTTTFIQMLRIDKEILVPDCIVCLHVTTDVFRCVRA